MSVPAKRRRQGFTLLEVMLAFVLLAAAMGVLIAMLSNGLRQVRQAQAETEESLHAQSLLDQIGALEPIEPGRRDGEFDRGRYRYSLDISQAEDPAPVAQTPLLNEPASGVIVPLLYRIELRVRWGAEEPRQQLRFVSLRARMPQADSLPTP